MEKAVFNLINVIDDDNFQKEIVDNLPESWEAELRNKNGNLYLYVDSRFSDVAEKELNRNQVKYISMIERE